jgi:hypothetical protein
MRIRKRSKNNGKRIEENLQVLREERLKEGIRRSFRDQVKIKDSV